ncbi:MAG: GGDEF domain-containing protein [Cellvibrionales bacterium]|jgi:diguanylate cyclase (GGDEF)-like protein|nr:GGDEF domain-containing protein [Cellvibrionales bacterium]MBK8675024.1 GGDEF domain-containing protein [Cellvibrionales bacterium]
MSASRHTGVVALLLRLMDWFIPLVIRADKVQRTRAYILVGIVLVNLCVCVLMALMLLSTSLSPLGMRAGIGVVVVSATIYLIALGVFNRRHSLVEAGNIAVLAIYIAVLVGIAITGGYGHSPFMALWIVVPVFVFPMAGARSGIVWTAIVFLTINVLMLAKKWGFAAWQLSDSTTLSLLENALPIVLCFMVVSALMIYERVNLTLYRWLEEERIRFAFKASHDSLTDLPNREEFYTRLDTALREAAQKKAQFALVYVDLDNFKPINDQFGHFAGDKVLKVTAQRLREVLRNTDLASRIGGDEFALILHGIQKRSDIDLAMNKMLYTLAIPIDVGGQDVVVNASAGVAIFPQDSRDMTALCRLADGAMYLAKEKRNTFCYHSPLQGG